MAQAPYFTQRPSAAGAAAAAPFSTFIAAVPFNRLSYLDSIVGIGPDTNPNLFPPTPQGPVLPTQMGASFTSLAYRDYYAAPVNQNLYAPGAPATPKIQSLLGVPFGALSYRDLSLFGDNNGILPHIVQTPTSTFLNFVENITPYNAKSYRDPVNYDGGSNAFLPGIIQGKVQSLLGSPFNGLNYRDSYFDSSAFLPNIIQGQVNSLLGVSFNGLNYRDYSTRPSNPSLFPIVSVSPFFNPLASVPFNNLGYRDTGNVDTSAFLPATIQGPVQSLLGVPFSSLSYRDSYFDGTAFLPNLIQPQIETFLQNVAPYNTKSYRDTYAYPVNLELFPPPGAVAPPFIHPLLGIPFSQLSFRDTANVGDNAFLPATIQGQVQSLLGAPFSGLSYRDSLEVLRNPVLYSQVVAPFILSLPGAPFSSLSYRDTSSLYPPSAFLPKSIQPSVRSLLGSPFSSISYRDSYFDGTAFLPNLIQNKVQSLLGVPFSGLGYRDSFIPPVAGIFYVPAAAFIPFFSTTPNVPFNQLFYQDQSLCARDPVAGIVIVYLNQNATVRIAIQDQFGDWLQPPFETGWFMVSTSAGQIILERNTNSQYVRFTSFVEGQWYLDADIRASDTQHIPGGSYYYESSLGDAELETGLFIVLGAKPQPSPWPITTIINQPGTLALFPPGSAILASVFNSMSYFETFSPPLNPNLF